jgi:hypothetical protein
MMVRDLKILKHLSFGPATRKDLLRQFFSKEGKNDKTRERVMMRRLNKLEQAKLLSKKTSPMFTDSIYVLRKEAAHLVAARYGAEVTALWTGVSDKHLDHDLCTARVARKIVAESEDLDLYDLDRLSLECSLRSDNPVQKGVYYPDFEFTISGPTKPNIFSLEIDCGTISRRDFVGKMKYFRGTILVVATTTQRVDLLMWYLRASGITKPVYLAVHKEFMSKSNTLFTMQWYSHLADDQATLELL